MHRDLLAALVANVRKRASEGDSPVTPAYPVETLENAILDLAALSPEAPTREWSVDDMRELVTDEQVRWLVSATDVAQGRVRLKDILNALTPRHEAPASEGDA